MDRILSNQNNRVKAWPNWQLKKDVKKTVRIC